MSRVGMRDQPPEGETRINAHSHDTALAANRRVADTLALLDHGAPDAVPPSVRRIAALLGYSVEAASYIDALETRVGRLEEKVAELRYDVRKVRRAA